MSRYKFSSLILGLVISALSLVAYTKAIQEHELAQGTDTYGYLQGRQDLLRGIHEGHWPDYFIDGKQVQTFAGFFRSQGIATERWNLTAGPLSYYYNDKTRLLINQYPPGVGALLSVFPEGSSIRIWNTLSLIAFLFFFLAYCRTLNSSASDLLKLGALSALAFSLIHTLGTIAGRSCSINLLLLPLTASLYFWFHRKRFSRLSAGLSGALFGICVLIRVPAVLVLPVFLAVDRRRADWATAVAAFLFFGVLPLALFQYKLTGFFWHTTYGPLDTGAPSFESIKTQLDYYLLGSGAGLSWVFLIVWIGCLACEFSNRIRIISVAALTWAVSLAFFLTHSVMVPYYMIPGALSAIACLVFGIYTSEVPVNVVQGWSYNGVEVLRALAVLPGLLAFEQSVVFVLRNFHEIPEGWRGSHLLFQADHFASTEVPQELLKPEAWIYGDMTTGSFWYYHRKNAFKIQYTDVEIRKKWFDYVRLRGEPQYLVQDQIDMPKYMDELRSFGAVLEPIGEAFTYPVYRITYKVGRTF